MQSPLDNLNDETKKTVFINSSSITSELLSSTCELLVERAENGIIKQYK